MSKHTPGPWATITRRGSWDWVVYSVDDSNIEICQPFHDDTEFNETGEANARLISAAPDMLAALQDIIQRNEIQHWFNLDQARAAVAKATGETAPSSASDERQQP